MMLTVFGGRGFVLGEYIKQFHHHAIGHIQSINARDDYEVYSEDVLYGISTLHNFHVYSDTQIDIKTNLSLLMVILENWKKWQTEHGKKGVFNYLSSWSVYGSQIGCLSVPENAPCYPRGFYIVTKYAAELLLREFCETFGLKYRIMRLGNVIGTGDTKVSSQKNQLQYNIGLLSQDKDVELWGDGNFYRDFLQVSDAARAIDLVITKGEENALYNVGNGYDNKNPDATWTYKEILEFAKKELNSKGHINYVSPTEFQKSVPVSSLLLDTTKLRSLGYVPRYTEENLYRSILR